MRLCGAQRAPGVKIRRSSLSRNRHPHLNMRPTSRRAVDCERAHIGQIRGAGINQAAVRGNMDSARAEIVREEDSDFETSGLRVASVIRVGRLAVVEADILQGAAGEIATDRLQRIKTRLSQWLEKVPDEASTEVGG